MKKLRKFDCVNCGESEHFVKDDEVTVNCNCGRKAVKKLSAPKYWGNTTGKAPS